MGVKLSHRLFTGEYNGKVEIRKWKVRKEEMELKRAEVELKKAKLSKK